MELGASFWSLPKSCLFLLPPSLHVFFLFSPVRVLLLLVVLLGERWSGHDFIPAHPRLFPIDSIPCLSSWVSAPFSLLNCKGFCRITFVLGEEEEEEEEIQTERTSSSC